MAHTPHDEVLTFWNRIRPYWHVATFVITMAAIAGTQWSKVNSYDQRIIALEVWRIDTSKDMATMQQEVHDIHEQVVPRAGER